MLRRGCTFFLLHLYRLGRLLVQKFDPFAQLAQQRLASSLHPSDILCDDFIVDLVGHPHIVPQLNGFVKCCNRLVALARDRVVLECKTQTFSLPCMSNLQCTFSVLKSSNILRRSWISLVAILFNFTSDTGPCTRRGYRHRCLLLSWTAI
jgi:hypothetical protein